MKKYLLAGLIIIILISFGVAVYLNSQKDPDNNSVVPNSEITPTLIQTTPPKLVVSTSDKSDLKQGGSSYSDPQGIYSFLYPSDYKQDLQNDGQLVRVYKIGPTQRGQTEIYDGVIVFFERVSLAGMSLSDWVDKKIESMTEDGTSQVTEPKKSLDFNRYQGFTYQVRGLGEFRYFVISKNSVSDNAVVITTLVADPQNLGFQKEVDSILATVELH